MAITFEQFKTRAKSTHGDKYEYNESTYINLTTKMEIKCMEHNSIFLQRPNDHTRGTGCKMCKSALIKAGNNNRLKLDIEYLSEMNLKHNNKYQYKLNNKRIKKRELIKIICPIHGEFNQKLEAHLNGHGCSKCANSNKPIRQDFIERAKALNLNINYSKVNYVNMDTKVTLVCNSCNLEWDTKPASHISYKTGCPKCRYSKVGWNKQKFVERCEGELGILYLIKMYTENEEFYKIGITSTSVKQRYSDVSKTNCYSYDILLEIKTLPHIVFDKEKTIKTHIKNANMHYKPQHKFGGSFSECFKTDHIENLIDLI